MSKVIALAGKVNSGKSTIGKQFAESQGWSYVSFGDYVRQVTRDRSLPDVRESWQSVGEELVRTNMEGFCRSVLSQAPDWKHGMPLVIDGVRHIEVNNLLMKLVEPSRYVLALVEVDDETRKRRADEEGSGESDLIGKIDAHSTELQVAQVLRHVANYTLKGDDPLPNLINQLKNISLDYPKNTTIPPNSNVRTLLEEVHELTLPEQREILAQLLSDQAEHASEFILKNVKFGDEMRIVAYAEEQKPYIKELQDLLKEGTMALLEDESEGTYQVFGASRIFYVTMTPKREFAAILSSWSSGKPPKEFILSGLQ